MGDGLGGLLVLPLQQGRLGGGRLGAARRERGRRPAHPQDQWLVVLGDQLRNRQLGLEDRHAVDLDELVVDLDAAHVARAALDELGDDIRLAEADAQAAALAVHGQPQERVPVRQRRRRHRPHRRQGHHRVLRHAAGKLGAAPVVGDE